MIQIHRGGCSGVEHDLNAALACGMAPDGSDARDVALLNLALFEGGVVEGPEVADIRLVDVDVAQANAARTAFSRYGKGRHPAELNFGDCFAYTLARVSRGLVVWASRDPSLQGPSRASGTTPMPSGRR